MRAVPANRLRPIHLTPPKRENHRANALIIALAILFMVAMLAFAFLSLVSFSEVTTDVAVAQLRAEWLAKSGQHEAHLWLLDNPNDDNVVLYFHDTVTDLLSYKGYYGAKDLGAVASPPFTLGGNPHIQGELRMSVVNSSGGDCVAPQF